MGFEKWAAYVKVEEDGVENSNYGESVSNSIDNVGRLVEELETNVTEEKQVDEHPLVSEQSE